jgi:hypothetical protein
MRSGTRLVVLAGVAAAALGTFTTPSHADCAAPTVTAPTTAHVGETISVQGEYWTTECNDTVVCSVGCGGESCEGGEPATPADGLRIAIKPVEATPMGPEGSAVQLADGIVADDELRIEQDVIVPAYFQPGRYVILVGNERDFGGWYESGIIRVTAG